MTLIDLSFRSEVIGKKMMVRVLYPDDNRMKENVKVLWLLHGMRHDHASWSQMTGLERYVEDKNVCIIMPSVDLSYYTDMKYGYRYFTYLTEELPEKMHNLLSLSNLREDNYIAGLSMGGYGALKAALRYPERYSKVASLSGVVDIPYMYTLRRDDQDLINHFGLIFGTEDEVSNSSEDLFFLAENLKAREMTPKIFISCGADDILYKMNCNFAKKIESMKLSPVFEVDEDHSHNWKYWDYKIQRVLDWMEL